MVTLVVLVLMTLLCFVGDSQVTPEHCYDLTRTTETEVLDFCGSGVPADRYGK